VPPGARTGQPGRQTAAVHARSALFDAYGDHLRARGGVAPVAALVRLLAPLEVSEPAVRTAVSRMVRQGWLRPVAAGGPGYAITEAAAARLDAAAQRIYEAGQPWDGRWHLAVLTNVPATRPERRRLRSQLAYLGYAALGSDTWVAPRESPELAATLADHRLRATTFHARLDGDGARLARDAWDLAGLAASYREWTGQATRLLRTAGGHPDDATAYAIRFRLVHEWRKFLFRDPDLPADLLPPDWSGREARSVFDAAARRLRPAADRFVDACLAGPAGTRTSTQTGARDHGRAGRAERSAS